MKIEKSYFLPLFLFYRYFWALNLSQKFQLLSTRR